MTDISPEQIQYINQIKRHVYIVRTARIFILFGFLILWELARRYRDHRFFYFQQPFQDCPVLPENGLGCRSIFFHIWTTLYETIISFLLVTAFSILAAVLLWSSVKLSEILDPYLVVLNSLPKSALAPLLIVWLGANSKTIIVAGMSVAIFGSILNLYTEFKTVDPEKIKLIYTLHGTKRHALTKVILPGSVPAIISNMKVNIGLCLVGVIIGEFLAARNGLGYLMHLLQSGLQNGFGSLMFDPSTLYHGDGTLCA